MEYVIEPFGSLCALETFIINEINADQADFVVQYDYDEENAEPYGCGDMCADTIPASAKVLARYKINLTEYEEIANKVSEKLSFGSCGWCI